MISKCFFLPQMKVENIHCVYNTKCDVFGFPVAVNRLNFKKVSTFFILLKDCYVASKAVS